MKLYKFIANHDIVDIDSGEIYFIEGKVYEFRLSKSPGFLKSKTKTVYIIDADETGGTHYWPKQQLLLKFTPWTNFKESPDGVNVKEVL